MNLIINNKFNFLVNTKFIENTEYLKEQNTDDNLYIYCYSDGFKYFKYVTDLIMPYEFNQDINDKEKESIIDFLNICGLEPIILNLWKCHLYNINMDFYNGFKQYYYYNDSKLLFNYIAKYDDSDILVFLKNNNNINNLNNYIKNWLIEFKYISSILIVQYALDENLINFISHLNLNILYEKYSMQLLNYDFHIKYPFINKFNYQILNFIFSKITNIQFINYFKNNIYIKQYLENSYQTIIFSNNDDITNIETFFKIIENAINIIYCSNIKLFEMIKFFSNYGANDILTNNKFLSYFNSIDLKQKINQNINFLSVLIDIEKKSNSNKNIKNIHNNIQQILNKL